MPSSTAPTACSTRSSTRSTAGTFPDSKPIREFLSRSLAIGDQLILPLHGAPPLISAQAVQARQEINRRLDRFIERGRADGSIRAAVNATDIIVFSALITQPLPHGPDWPLIAGRQLAIFVNGLAASGPDDIPGPRGDAPGHRDDLHAPRPARTPRAPARTLVGWLTWPPPLVMRCQYSRPNPKLPQLSLDIAP